MVRKFENIVTYSGEELEAMQGRGEDRTDWKKASVAPMPDGSDPDDFMEQGEFVTTELPMPRTKVHASLRLDADMLDWFKSQGRGYQTRINAVLRLYFQQRVR